MHGDARREGDVYYAVGAIALWSALFASIAIHFIVG